MSGAENPSSLFWYIQMLAPNFPLSLKKKIGFLFFEMRASPFLPENEEVAGADLVNHDTT
jgi:hypothetical protein